MSKLTHDIYNFVLTFESEEIVSIRITQVKRRQATIYIHLLQENKKHKPIICI